MNWEKVVDVDLEVVLEEEQGLRNWGTGACLINDSKKGE